MQAVERKRLEEERRKNLSAQMIAGELPQEIACRVYDVSNRYNGVVETQDSYEVNVDSSRTISEIKVEVGDEVEEGQTLVTYDTSDLTMKIEQAKLELEGIQNEIDNYNKQIDTLTKEMEKVDESERYDYTTQIQNIQNSIAQKQFDMESKKLEISKEQKQVSSSSVVSKVA